ncbi:hypothetical protein GCM10020367_35230 [Streptomyces sannanensis]|uniref:LigA protein n=1 Tax=Streptomyces sannanensis TaxID=285536 RepID=A0ABP6SD29_9ACTN
MPFEDEFGEVLRRTGDSFTTDRQALVEGGLTQGRRRRFRRNMAAMTGSVLALAVVGTAGAYGGGLLGGTGGRSEISVAAPATGSGAAAPEGKPMGTGKVSAEQMIKTLKDLLPEGKFSRTEARGTGDMHGPMASGVFEDGKGAGAIGISLSRVDPHGREAEQQTACPDRNHVPYESCTSERLADGSRLMLMRGWEYPDRREDTKAWRAVLVTPQGYLVNASEWNAPAEKGATVTRTDPPLSLAQLKAVVTAKEWHPALADLPAPDEAAPVDEGPSRAAVEEALASLLPEGLEEIGRGGDGSTYLVVDDGKGASFVGVTVQWDASKVEDDLFGTGATTLPDGTKVKTAKRPGEKGGEGVVSWSADTMRPDGFRVLVTAYNSGAQITRATRAEPALTVEQLKAIALDEKWRTLK